MVSVATEHRQSSDAAAGAHLADIEALYRAEYDRFVAVAAVLCGDADLGRDAVQDGFALAIRSRAAFRGEGPLAGWVWRIVLNSARSAGRRRRPVALEAVPERAQAPAPRGTPNIELLYALPERRRTVLFLRYYADLDYRAIAAVLGMEVGTVGSTLNAALAALRRGMAGEVAG
jgi:DNA-directed RNA polymerase specialized sigma24 family protein